MSREILFKAKRKNWREIPKEEWWIEGLPIEIKEKLYISTEYDGIDDKTDFGMVQFIIQKSLIEIDPETICQYTGLTDKNDKQIWENDIVQHVQRHAQRGANLRVSWHTFCASWMLSREEWMNRFFGEGVEPEDVEVIGNFFDNPELLEDSDLTD